MKMRRIVFGLILLLSLNLVVAFSWSDLLPTQITGHASDGGAKISGDIIGGPDGPDETVGWKLVKHQIVHEIAMCGQDTDDNNRGDPYKKGDLYYGWCTKWEKITNIPGFKEIFENLPGNPITDGSKICVRWQIKPLTDNCLGQNGNELHDWACAASVGDEAKPKLIYDAEWGPFPATNPFVGLKEDIYLCKNGCKNGACNKPEVGGMKKTCNSDKVCGECSFCSEEGVCEEGACSFKTSCINDDQCNVDEYCYRGYCTEQNFGGMKKKCSANRDCNSEEVCYQNYCVDGKEAECASTLNEALSVSEGANIDETYFFRIGDISGSDAVDFDYKTESGRWEPAKNNVKEGGKVDIGHVKLNVISVSDATNSIDIKANERVTLGGKTIVYDKNNDVYFAASVGSLSYLIYVDNLGGNKITIKHLDYLKQDWGASGMEGWVTLGPYGIGQIVKVRDSSFKIINIQNNKITMQGVGDTRLYGTELLFDVSKESSFTATWIAPYEALADGALGVDEALESGRTSGTFGRGSSDGRSETQGSAGKIGEEIEGVDVEKKVGFFGRLFGRG